MKSKLDTGTPKGTPWYTARKPAQGHPIEHATASFPRAPAHSPSTSAEETPGMIHADIVLYEFFEYVGIVATKDVGTLGCDPFRKFQ